VHVKVEPSTIFVRVRGPVEEHHLALIPDKIPPVLLARPIG
jgi:hypothetical protein